MMTMHAWRLLLEQCMVASLNIAGRLDDGDGWMDRRRRRSLFPGRHCIDGGGHARAALDAHKRRRMTIFRTRGCIQLAIHVAIDAIFRAHICDDGSTGLCMRPVPGQCVCTPAASTARTLCWLTCVLSLSF